MAVVVVGGCWPAANAHTHRPGFSQWAPVEDYHVGKGSVGGGVNVCFVFLWLLVLTVDGDVEVRAALTQREGSDGGQKCG